MNELINQLIIFEISFIEMTLKTLKIWRNFTYFRTYCLLIEWLCVVWGQMEQHDRLHQSHYLLTGCDTMWTFTKATLQWQDSTMNRVSVSRAECV